MYLPIVRGKKHREERKSGGLGSSHTTPCGAAVPARPPTRSSDISGSRQFAQWATRLIPSGTRVVVQPSYRFSPALRFCRATLGTCFATFARLQGFRQGLPIPRREG